MKKPKWRLMEQEKGDVAFDLEKIITLDNRKIGKGGFSGDGLVYEYVVRISGSIADILERMHPGSRVESIQVSGDDAAVNGLRVSGTRVSIVYRRGKTPELFVKVDGEEGAANKLKKEIDSLKKELS